MEILSYLIIVGAVIAFIINKAIISFFHVTAEQILQSDSHTFHRENFTHFFLANAGLFICSMRFTLITAFFSMLHSFFLILLILVNIANLIWGSMTVVYISIPVFLMLFMSNVATSYPIINDHQRTLDRAIDNYAKKYPNDVIETEVGFFPTFESVLENYYKKAWEMTKDYYSKRGLI